MADAVSTKNPGRDAVIFILFLLALGILWFVRGGPERASQNPPAGPFMNSTGFSPGSSVASNGDSGAEGGVSDDSYPSPIPVGVLYEELGIDENF